MKNARWILAVGAATLLGLFLLVPPLRQPQSYHRFADRRLLVAGIPNTLNVVSNLAFVVAGAMGLAVLRRPRSFDNAYERTDALAFFAGTILTGVGSTIYHLAPRDATLVYDRAGMTIAFMAFLSMIVHEHYAGAKALLPASIVFGLASVAWWRAFDDLRPYGWVQFFPIVAVVAIVARERRRYTGELATLVAVLVAYAAAKLFEAFDGPVYAATAHLVSGHTLKHVAAAAAPAAVARWIATRDARS